MNLSLLNVKKLVNRTRVVVQDKNTNNYISQEKTNAEKAAQLYSQYQDFIRIITYHKIQNPDLAEEFFQEFFISLCHSPLPDNVRNIKSYLYITLVNAISDYLRQTNRDKIAINKYIENFDPSGINIDDPKDVYINKEQAIEIFKLAEEKLPPRQAEAVILRYKNGYDTEETANKMGVDKRTVSRYLAVGLAKIRELMKLGD